MCTDEHVQTVPDGIVTIKISEVRCACADCGAHVVAWQGYKISGWCENCGSYDVRPLPAPLASALPLAS
jgi:Zn finger protein HypA/HybF involved in hydrogenase expression